MPSNPEVYPVTAALEESLAGCLTEEHAQSPHVFKKLVDAATGFIGEYEHGSVDLPEGITLQEYSDAVSDFVQYIIYGQAL